MAQKPNYKEQIYRLLLKKKLNSCIIKKYLHIPLNLNLMNLQISSIYLQFLICLKSWKSLLYQSILVHLLFQIKLNDKISMLKYKKVDTSTTTLGQINQAVNQSSVHIWTGTL